MLSAAKKPLGDWAAEALSIGGDVPFTIDDLRVSDSIRYDRDFAKPGPLPADGDTLLLMAF